MSPLNVIYDEATQEATFFIDNSSMEKFDTCQRSAELYLNFRRESNREKTALKFGGIIHKILEYRYRHFEKDVFSQFEDLVQVAASEFEKWTVPEDEYRTYAMAIEVIKEYGRLYPFETFDIVNLNYRPAVEVPFACPLTTIEVNAEFKIWAPSGAPTMFETVFIKRIHVVIKGKMDLITRREGRLYPFDHKTTSMMGPTYFADFEISSQVYTYSWACRELTGETPYGFVINALGVRKETKSGKKLEFKRHTVMVYDALISEWKNDTIHKCADYFEMCRRGYFPKQTKWCAGKYGMCEYHGVCTLSPEMRQIALSTNEFKNVTWDPLKTED